MIDAGAGQTVEPDVNRRPRGRSAYRTRGTAGVAAIYSTVVSLVWTLFPLALAAIFVLVGGGLQGPLGFALDLIPIALASIFVLAGIPMLLEGVGRIQVGLAGGEALIVGEDGITMAGMGHLGWDEIAAVRIGRAAVVGSRYSRENRPRLEIVPRDLARLAARPRAARARDAFLARRRRLDVRRDQAPRTGAFILGLDQLEANSADILERIARYRGLGEAG